MTTIKKMFSYDDEFDKDVHDFLKSLPSKKQSSCIRRALRLYMKQQEEGTQMIMLQKEKQHAHYDESIYTEEIDDDFLIGFDLLSEVEFEKLHEKKD